MREPLRRLMMVPISDYRMDGIESMSCMIDLLGLAGMMEFWGLYGTFGLGKIGWQDVSEGGAWVNFTVCFWVCLHSERHLGTSPFMIFMLFVWRFLSSMTDSRWINSEDSKERNIGMVRDIYHRTRRYEMRSNENI